MKKADITFTRGIHSEADIIEVRFEYRQDITGAMRNLGSARCELVSGMWYIPVPQFQLGEVFKALSPVAYLDYSALKRPVEKDGDQATPARPVRRTLPQSEDDVTCRAVERFPDYLLGIRYSENTIATYCGALQSFLRWTHPKPVGSLSNEDVTAYVLRHLLPGEYSFSFQNQVINAVKLFFREVLQSGIQPDKLQRPRREHKLPNVLSKEEIAAILSAHGNLKHRAMLSLIYACGLRRSELLDLKPADVDSKRHLLKIQCGKGRKDRVVPISDKVIAMLREYFTVYRPKVWLFEG
jgi:integrase/recombinase XerD